MGGRMHARRGRRKRDLCRCELCRCELCHQGLCSCRHCGPVGIDDGLGESQEGRSAMSDLHCCSQTVCRRPHPGQCCLRATHRLECDSVQQGAWGLVSGAKVCAWYGNELVENTMAVLETPGPLGACFCKSGTASRSRRGGIRPSRSLFDLATTRPARCAAKTQRSQHCKRHSRLA